MTFENEEFSRRGANVEVAPLDSEKQALRRKAYAIRQAIPREIRAGAAALIAQNGLDFLAAAPDTIAAYHPIRSEFDCFPLLERLVSEGWRIALPITDKGQPLNFRLWTFGDPLQPDPYGIPQPVSGPPAMPSHLLLPMLAFDRRGYRLGYGGGHYDRTLAKLRAEGPVQAIGLAFDQQEVTEVPVGPYDQRLDWILTPAGPRRGEERI